MSTTSQKHHNFVSEPMGDKPVTDLAGIGEVLGKRLSDQGFDRAFVVLGQYLVLKKDPELFVEWMKENAKANTKQATDCCQCLSECEHYLLDVKTRRHSRCHFHRHDDIGCSVLTSELMITLRKLHS